jgi:putative transposon-encoded protein
MRKMKNKQIKSTVTKSGNSEHIIIHKDWVGQDVIVENKNITKSEPLIISNPTHS